jgi:hypothetical protein
MEKLLGVCLRVVYDAHCCNVVHDLVVCCPEQVIRGVQLACVPVHKLQLQARLWKVRARVELVCVIACGVQLSCNPCNYFLPFKMTKR